jgi:uncharacterized UPF0160 family protein
MFFSKKIKVAVHDGSFHPDDVFAVAILHLYLKKPLKIFRTRDKNIFDEMDYVLDVGREYNPKEGKFDHHQEGWSEKRENGIPYAASGLVWKEFGEKICGSKEVADKIEEKIIEPIDAEDSGVEIYKSIFEKISPYSFFDYLFSFNPTWKENTDTQKVFLLAVDEAKKMLVREIKRAKDNCLASSIVKNIYEKTEDKRIIILDNNYSWRKILVNYPEPLFVISPKLNDTWSIDTVVKPNEKFLRRMYFPKSWAGKIDGDLEKVSGVKGSVFCHNDRFIAISKTKEGAIALAQKAIASYN